MRGRCGSGMIGRHISGERRVIRKHRRPHIAEPAQPRRRAGRTRTVERGAGDHPESPLGARLPATRAARGHAGAADRRGAVRVHLVQPAVLERGRGAGTRAQVAARGAGRAAAVHPRRTAAAGVAGRSVAARSYRGGAAGAGGRHALSGGVHCRRGGRGAGGAERADRRGIAGAGRGLYRRDAQPAGADRGGSSQLPPHVFAVFGMSIGYPDPARPTDIKPRLPQSRGAASGAVFRSAT